MSNAMSNAIFGSRLPETLVEALKAAVQVPARSDSYLLLLVILRVIYLFIHFSDTLSSTKL